MPDVIDLLSSSPVLPAPKVTKKADLPAPPHLSLPSKALHSATKRNNDDWFSLSSDSIDANSFLPPTKTAPKPPSNTSVKPKASLNVSQLEITSNDGIFFLSDDFDSTVISDDDPFASDPPPKKLRLSPPSDPSMISNQTTIIAPSCNTGAPIKSAAPKTNSRLSKGNAPKTSCYKRSSSDQGTSSKFAAPRASNSGLKRSKAMGTVMESDPIVFTSSPDPLADARKRKEKRTKEIFSQILVDSSDGDVFDLSPRKEAKGKMGPLASTILTSGRGNVLPDFEFESSDLDLPDAGAIPSQIGMKTAANGNGNGRSGAMEALDKYEAEKAKEKKQREKERKAQDKSAAKETEKEQKRLAKEGQVRAKDRAAELVRVNVLRTDKKKSTPEMIVDLPDCLDARLAEQITTFLKPVEAQHASYKNTRPIIKWRRKIDSAFNEEADHWEKVNPYIGREKHVMCIIKAQEFVALAAGEEGKDLDSHVLRLKSQFPTSEIIYLMEGLEPWMRKNKISQNRKYIQDVRSQIPEEANASTVSQKRKKKPELEHVDEDLVEDVLLKLQVVHGVLIHHTKVQIETAEWVVIFTQHISTVRYRAQKQSLNTAFCMESGQVKPGDGPADTYTKMLQEMVRVTAPVAYGIAAKYPSVQKLVQGFREDGLLALEDCRKTANKDGAFTDKRVGPSVSKRVYNVFMCRDAGSWDV